MNNEVISLSGNRIIFHSSTIGKLMIRVELSMIKYLARLKKRNVSCQIKEFYIIIKK